MSAIFLNYPIAVKKEMRNSLIGGFVEIHELQKISACATQLLHLNQFFRRSGFFWLLIEEGNFLRN
ncbi:MAG: hypothetical protein N2747_02125 [Chitinophagaceae bacterium]|nr:hypothetical protein [Chitinophagaceae bacterium]